MDLALVIFKFGIEFHQLLTHLEGNGKYKSIYERFPTFFMMIYMNLYSHIMFVHAHTHL
jgi:hypothetical protein